MKISKKDIRRACKVTGSDRAMGKGPEDGIILEVIDVTIDGEMIKDVDVFLMTPQDYRVERVEFGQITKLGKKVALRF